MTTIVAFNDFNGIKESFTEDEIKEKIKEAVRISHEKTVLCVDTNEIFSSIREATEKTGASHIGEVCNGNRKKSGGFYWRFI